MGCTPFTYVANSGVNGIPTNGTIPLGSVVREHNDCCAKTSCKLDGTGIVCKGNGTAFAVVGDVTLEPATTTDATANDATDYISISVLQNGSTVQGSRKSAPSTARVTLPISCVIRNDCCSSSVITLFNTGVEVNVVNLALIIKPI